ncbi:type I-E CRISPR-associated protein Cse1/CasA [Streptomyces sp. NPDC050619]|uniref:type I-E CRISPR-associated protein Cse1/CasA n=1 Tax=Streptomyces sp. NPDC050619 TaxID=3157214 RepID=UPI00343CF685
MLGEGLCLLDDLGWVPVVVGGTVREVPLREALLEAHAFEALSVELPTMAPAVLRQVLLPVVLDALGPLDAGQWAELMAAGAFTPGQREAIGRYLDKRRDRFRVFDEEAPFGQVAGLAHPGGAVKPVSVLMPHVATGNNTPLRDGRSTADPVPLPVGAAVRWMLHTQCWDTAAIKTGAVGDPAVKAGKTSGNHTGLLGRLGVVTLLGRTLFETIVLNLPQGERASGDVPQWDRVPQQPAWTVRAADGVLDLFTWQGRRIRLIPEETPDGVRVKWVVLSAGDRLAALPEDEPHTCWTLKEDKAKGSLRYPRRHLPGRAGWRGLEALLTIERNTAGFETSRLLMQTATASLMGDLPPDYPLRVATCGTVYGNKDSIVADVLADELPLPVAALRADLTVRESVVRVCEQAETLARALDRLVAHLARAVGGEPVPPGKGQPPGTKLLYVLDPLVRRFLAGCQRNPDPGELDRAHRAFEQMAERATRAAADELLQRLPGSAFTGRTVEEKNGATKTTRIYRQADAERIFHGTVRKTLTYLYPTEPVAVATVVEESTA